MLATTAVDTRLLSVCHATSGASPSKAGGGCYKIVYPACPWSGSRLLPIELSLAGDCADRTYTMYHVFDRQQPTH